MSNVYTGTIKELVAMNLKINGNTLGQAELSVLTRLGKGTFATDVGTAPRPAGQKGKPATIWSLNADATLAVSA